MRKPLPNPFMTPSEPIDEFELDAAAFLDAIAPDTAPADHEPHDDDAPSVVGPESPYLKPSDERDLDDLAGIPKPRRRY